ncbi:hypothetical protein G6F37_013200 [Rhizopus arrhizus]|nr:hypothetical protein G6F38_013145 [Rhizopus arrhizus]KAG1139177.1 hypothetical protein G6F37_013200 [Rhizopus arrhizus]
MQSADDTASQLLHSLGTRPHYDWTPSDALTALMSLDTPLHTSPMLSETERKAIIESYLPMSHVDYKAPATIPTAERAMNKIQRHEDNSLKHLQYLLSAAFRSLDILSHELVSCESGNPNLERYCKMLFDVRKLLLHVCSSMTQARNNVALQAINPSFSLKSDTEVTYTLPLDEFQQTLIQQTTARKVTREATAGYRQRRSPNNSSDNSGSFSNFPVQQFFRPGPPSQQGGFTNNSSTTISNNNFRPTNFNSSKSNSNNTNRRSNNPFRQWIPKQPQHPTPLEVGSASIL